MYRDRARTITPATACAGASDLKAAANARKKAFIDSPTTNKKTKKVLGYIRGLNSVQRIEGRIDAQELARSLLELDDEV